MMMVMVMALACTATAFAAEADKAEGTVHELYYTTYNEKGEIVEEGIIPLNENSKYTWKSGTKTSSGTSISYTTNKDAYYFVGVTNASSDDITISNVSFVF